MWVFLGPEAPGPARTLPFSFGPGAPVVLALSETKWQNSRHAPRGAARGQALHLLAVAATAPGSILGPRGFVGPSPAAHKVAVLA